MKMLYIALSFMWCGLVNLGKRVRTMYTCVDTEHLLCPVVSALAEMSRYHLGEKLGDSWLLFNHGSLAIAVNKLASWGHFIPWESVGE